MFLFRKNLVPKTRTGRAKITLKFDKPLQDSLYALLHCEFQAAISIDHKYKVSLSYDTTGG
jgi:hypothetical protein